MNFGKCLAQKTCLNQATVSLKFKNFVLKIDFPKWGNQFPELKKKFWQVEINFLERRNRFPELKNDFFQMEIDFHKWGNRFPKLFFEKIHRKISKNSKGK